jgi:hypothetical protein
VKEIRIKFSGNRLISSDLTINYTHLQSKGFSKCFILFKKGQQDKSGR